MGNFCGHNKSFASFYDVGFASDSEAPGAFKNCHHSVASGIVRANLLALVEGKKRNAYAVVLRKGFAYYFTRSYFH